MSEEMLLKCPNCIFNTSISSFRKTDNTVSKVSAQMVVISSSQPSTAVLSPPKLNSICFSSIF